MNVKDLRGLLGQGEGPQLDLKHPDVDPKVIARVVCAFLNGNGGRVVLGVAQGGTVEGVRDPEALATHLRHAVGGMVTPAAQWSVDILAVDNANVVLIEVPGGPDKPYVVDGAIWVRRGTTTVPAGRDELSALIGRLASAGPRWERQTALGAEWEDLDESLIMETAQRARSSGRWQGPGRDARAFMSGLGLLDAGRISNAGLVLFGKSPSRLLPQARVRLLVLPKGKTGARYALDREFEGPLLRIALTIEEALLAHVGGVESWFDDSGWRRTDRPLLPRRALDEGVLNALVHRDYAMTGPTLITIEPGKLTIANPGGLPEPLRPADLRKQHLPLPRNPDIAHGCFLGELVEKVGRGTQLIIEECEQAGLPAPRWQSTALATTLTIFATSTGREPIPPDTLNERQVAVIRRFAPGQSLRVADLLALFAGGPTERTLRTDLQVLVHGGWLERRGKGRATLYIRSRRTLGS